MILIVRAVTIGAINFEHGVTSLAYAFPTLVQVRSRIGYRSCPLAPLMLPCRAGFIYVGT